MATLNVSRGRQQLVANEGVRVSTKTSPTQGRKAFFLDVRKGSLIHWLGLLGPRRNLDPRLIMITVRAIGHNDLGHTYLPARTPLIGSVVSREIHDC